MCIYRLNEACDGGGNECGVPHSCVARADNMGLAPFEMYWWPTMLHSAVQFLAHGLPFGPHGQPPQPWHGNLSVCQPIDLSAPPARMFGAVGGVLELELQHTVEIVGDGIKAEVAAALAKAAGIPHWAIQPLMVAALARMRRRRTLKTANLAFYAPKSSAEAIVQLVGSTGVPMPHGMTVLSASYSTLEGTSSSTAPTSNSSSSGGDGSSSNGSSSNPGSSSAFRDTAVGVGLGLIAFAIVLVVMRVLAQRKSSHRGLLSEGTTEAL